MEGEKRERNCLVQSSTDVDGRLLNHIVHNIGKRSQEIRRINLWVEEDFRGEEPFIADVDGVFLVEDVSNQSSERKMEKCYPPSDTMLALEPLKVFIRLLIIFPKFPDDVLADITVILLHLTRDLEVVLRRHSRHLAPLSHQIEHELGDITPGDRDMLDRAPNDIAFRAGNNVRHAVARVDDGAGESAVSHAVGRPGRGEGEHGLDGDVQAFDVE